MYIIHVRLSWGWMFLLYFLVICADNVLNMFLADYNIIWKPSKSFLDLYLSFSSGPPYTVDPFLFVSSEMYRSMTLKLKPKCTRDCYIVKHP